MKKRKITTVLIEEMIKHINEIGARLRDVEKNELQAKYDEMRSTLDK